MKLTGYVYLWLLLTAAIGFEYWALTYNLKFSLLHLLARHWPKVVAFNLSTEPGRPLSYFLGWFGIGLIGLTNLYVFRKKFSPLKKMGTLPGWLNFHIFCGLLGPTCVVFHSGFKVRGLVGISFWSMIVVALSGIMGRYIYVQVLRQERDSNKDSGFWLEKFEQMIQKARTSANEALIARVKTGALRFVGIPADVNYSLFAFPKIFVGSILGDLRLMFSSPQTLPGLSQSSREVLANYAIAQRRIAFLEPFRKMLGYWHAFHLPFAFFMYIAAAVHIASEMMFRISK